MKRALTIIGLSAWLAGCATQDPYADRGSTGTAPAGVQSGPVDLIPPEQEIPRPPGSTPGTHPSDPRGGTGADDFGGTDRGQRSP